jgi:hypothetical protein
VWLGRSEADRSPDGEVKEHLAFSLIKKLDLHGDGPALDEFKDFVRNAVRANPLGVDLKALSWVLSHPWFTRLWVLQEVVVARYTLVLGQYQSVAFEHILVVAAAFRGVMAAEIEDQNRPSDAEEFLKLLDVCRIILERGAMKLQHRFKEHWEETFEELDLEKGTQLDAIEIMCRSRRYKCLDPRDRVFAMLHMLKDEMELRVTPDYRLPVAHLYSTLAVAMVVER